MRPVEHPAIRIRTIDGNRGESEQPIGIVDSDERAQIGVVQHPIHVGAG